MMRALLGILFAAAFAAACARSDRENPAADSTATASAPTPVAVDAGAPKLLPRDEADESFREFRARALGALARRDTAFLLAMLDPAIKVSFGGDDGIAGFRRIWKIDDPNTRIWTILARVLRLGGERTSDTMFVAPYVFAFWPDSLDAFEYVAVTDSAALVRARPDSAASIVGTASHSILRVREWSGAPGQPIDTETAWARVVLPDGRDGWISASGVYSPVGWRAAFVRRRDRWVMVFFVAGD